MTFITVLVGVNLVPTIANTVAGTTQATNATGGFAGTLTPTNVTGAGAALIGLIPLFFVLGILVTTVSASLEVLNKFNF